MHHKTIHRNDTTVKRENNMKTVAEKQTSHTIRSMSALKSKNSEWEDRCGRQKCAQGKLKEHLGSNRLLDDFSCATQVLSGEIFRRQRAFWSDLIFDYLAMSSTAQTLSSYSQCLFTSVPYRHSVFFRSVSPLTVRPNY